MEIAIVFLFLLSKQSEARYTKDLNAAELAQGQGELSHVNL